MTKLGHTRLRRRAMMAIPAALATATSVIFGLQAAHVAVETPRDPEAAFPRTPHATPESHDASVPRDRRRDGSYIVQSGDTLLAIAQSFRVSSVELLAANGLSWRTLLVVGQRLIVPDTTSGTAEHDRIDTVIRHSVKAGDTLEGIARAHQVQPRALMSANGLSKTSRLIVGQRLLIPNAQMMGGIEALS